MKKCLWTLLALAMFLPFGIFATAENAQAEEVQFELLAKIGGQSDSPSNESLGDPIFSVAGGLDFAAMFRFDMGLGIGLNLNWNMAQHRLDATKLTTALEAKKPRMTVQLPSFGLVIRYEVLDLIDLGGWLNYGFGNSKIHYDSINRYSAIAYGLNDANLKWTHQTFEFGLTANFIYKIAKINLDVLFGAQFFFDVSAMLADDNSLDNARDIPGRHLDENTLYSVGFNIVVGARYDLVFGNAKKKKGVEIE